MLGSEKLLESRMRESDFAWCPLGQKTNGFRINGEKLFSRALSALGGVVKGRAVRQVIPDRFPRFFEIVRTASARGSGDEREPSDR